MSIAMEKEATGHADEIIKAIKSHESSWDEAFRLALIRNQFCKWIGAGRDSELVDQVAAAINAEFKLPDDECVDATWYETLAEERREELIVSQDACCDEIEANKGSLEAATERAKSAKAAIEEGHSRLRFLSRELRKPYVFPLPSAPSRQRELPMADGEEWRAVPLAEVLAGDVVLRAIAGEKLGQINLGQYCAAIAEFGEGDKPKKLTRKQWDRIEAIVQEWHSLQAESDGIDAPAPDSEESGVTTKPGGHGVKRTKKRAAATAG